MQARDRVSLETLRRSLGRVAQEVERGSTIIVERRGTESFALIPMRIYRHLEEERRVLVESTNQAREAFSDLSGKEVEGLVAGEIATTGEETTSTARC